MGYYVIDIVVEITVVSIIKERSYYEKIRALKGMAFPIDLSKTRISPVKLKD